MKKDRNRRPSASEGDLGDINYDDLLYSIPKNDRKTDNLL